MNAAPRPRSPHTTSLQYLAECAGISATLHGADGTAPSILPAVEVTGVTLDSRAIQPGDLYAALPGARVHGAAFVESAVDLGAVAVLTDPAGAGLLALNETSVPVLVVPDPRARLGEISAQVYGRPSQELTMFGITGTNGKTTTAHILDSALRALGRVTGLIGTVETRIGQERINSVRTTPESTDLHALFAVMLENAVDTCTMEVSSHALSLHRVDAVRYDVAAFTNLSQDHLDFHGSMEDYYQAKASLFTPERAARGVVCVDDSWGRRLAKEASVPLLTVSSRSDVGADWEIQTHGGDPSAFELVGEGQRLSLRSALPGDFNRVNTAVAAVVLLAAGYAADAVIRALAAVPSVPGRMERVLVDDVDQSSMPLAVVDFAHTPDAVAAALKALRLHTSGALIVVLGAGGDRDSGKREAMGAAAAANADFVLVTDDNPRSEDPASIRAALLAGAAGSAHLSPDRVREIGDRAAAIGVAVDMASAGDTIAVLGRGHEVDQDIAAVIHPFDDRVELKAALRQFSAAQTHKKLREYTALSEHTAGGHADGNAMPAPDGGDPQ